MPAPSDRDARENAADSFVGRVLEQRYRVEERLGEGGLGTVYRAQHLKLARPVAVKVLRDDLRDIPQLRARFEREVKALSSLSHPNVVTITDYGVEGGMPYLVMELVEGTELAKMVVPGAMAIVTPVLVGFTMGAEALGGLLAGVTVSGVLLAIFMSNAGGAWDNAKKSFEGPGYTMADGTIHPKGSDAHKAAVVGDTVGDPFKDTAGPSLNILVKLMSVVALVIAPLLAS